MRYMTEIIGIRFNPAGKIYYFAPNGKQLRIGDRVIVETARGIEMGTVSIQNRSVSDDSLKEPLKPILRIATEDDFARVQKNKEKEKEAFRIAVREIEKHKLEMKLIRVEYTFDGSKILFYFTADGRVDFRELVKSLASVFRTRIELRQIGVRDEAKHLGALGICGRFLCCSSFLNDFQPVSIKMAKEQGLSLNPTKISGVCGRLMCCLQYEQNCYDDMLKIMPKAGAVVSTPEGEGTVTDVNLLKGTMKVRFENPDGVSFGQYSHEEVEILKGGRSAKKQDLPAANGEEIALPSAKEKKEKAERKPEYPAKRETAEKQEKKEKPDQTVLSGQENKPQKPNRRRRSRNRRGGYHHSGGGGDRQENSSQDNRAEKAPQKQKPRTE